MLTAAGAEPRRQLGQRQVVRRHQPDRAGLDERPHDRFGADPAIVRIGAVQNLVEQEQQRNRTARGLDDGADAQNLGVEARVPGLQRVLDPKRRAEGQRRQRSRAARTGAPASASTTLTPTDRSSVLFPDMFEPLTMMTRGPSPPRWTSFRTDTRSAISGWPSAWASNSGPRGSSVGNGSAGRS